MRTAGTTRDDLTAPTSSTDPPTSSAPRRPSRVQLTVDSLPPESATLGRDHAAHAAAAARTSSPTCSSSSASSSRPRRPGRSSTARAAGTTPEQVLLEQRRDHARTARPRHRRAPRPRPRRPDAVPGRHGRREPARHRRQALRGRPGRLRRRAHAARRDGRPGERPRDRRHRDHDGPRGPRRRRQPRGHRRPHQPHHPPRRRRRPTSVDEDLDDGPGRGRRPPRVRRRPAGHQARQPGHRPGRRAGRLGRPPRARGRRLRVRFRIDGVLVETTTIPKRMVCRRHQPREDHGRPRHRRAPRPAGRPRRPDDRRPPRRPPRRDAARASTASRSSCASSTRTPSSWTSTSLGMGEDDRERFEKAFRAGLRRRPRHRPDRLRQVDDALRRARRDQHAREEHHHDRGPGRVPGRRASPRSRSTRRPA